MRRASLIARPIVIDGFSEACGSWKTICSLRRSGRSRDSDRPDQFLAAVADASGARPDESEQRTAEGRLARTGLADHAEHLARCEVEVDSVNGVHHAGRAAEKASRSVGPQRVVQPAGRER